MKLFPLQNLQSNNQDIAFSPDGRFIATELQMWDAENGKPLHYFQKVSHDQKNSIHVAISPDSKKIATTDASNVTIFDSATANELVNLKDAAKRNSDARVLALAFTEDSNRVFTLSTDWSLSVYPLTIDGMLALSRDQVPEPLSPEQRKQYLHD